MWYGNETVMVISIANQKGGVGKTTTAVNLSASIAVSERRTLIIDMDSQCNTTSGFGIPYNNVSDHIYNVLIGEKAMADRIEAATAAVIAEGAVRTYDMGGQASTLDMAKAIVAKMA